MKNIIFGLILSVAVSPALAQQQPSATDDLAQQLGLTEQLLANANHGYVQERAQVIRLSNENARLGAQIKDLQTKLGAVTKEVDDLKKVTAPRPSPAAPSPPPGTRLDKDGPQANH